MACLRSFATESGPKRTLVRCSQSPLSLFREERFFFKICGARIGARALRRTFSRGKVVRRVVATGIGGWRELSATPPLGNRPRGGGTAGWLPEFQP